MTANPQVEAFEDRRQAQRVDLEGQYTICVDPCDGREPLECPVLDFSVTGMRIELPPDVPLPADVQILIASISHNARVVWRRDGVVGIDLIDEHHSIID